jgi:hypothetical protein
MFKQTTLFSFEALNQDKFWKMAVDIPVHGEELLSLGWENAGKGKVHIKGQFAKRLMIASRNHKDSNKYVPLIKGFIKGWSQFIYLNDTFSTSSDLKICDEGKCRLGKSSWKFSERDGHAYVDYELSNGKTLLFDFSDFKNNSARRISISTPGQTLENTPFQLDLFIRSCE